MAQYDANAFAVRLGVFDAALQRSGPQAFHQHGRGDRLLANLGDREPCRGHRDKSE
jgi:hypothetical protein